MSDTQRLPYIDPASITDPAMMAEFERAAREGAPRPESHAMRANVPAVFWAFTNAWNTTFVNGVCDHAIKELCRLYVSQAVNCNYCGNQRSVKAQEFFLHVSRPVSCRVCACLHGWACGASWRAGTVGHEP